MRIPLALTLVVLVGVPISADVLIVEKMVTKSGDKTVASVRSTSIKGTRMRVEIAQDGKTGVTVYDLPAGEMLELDATKRRADVRGVTARNAKLEKEYPRSRSTVIVTATGQSQNLDGAACADHTFAVRVPMTSSGDLALTLKGTACLSAAATGVDDYMTFATAAHAQNVVFGLASDNYILLALARAQTELFRALTEKSGMPLFLDLTFAVDGKGMLAGIVRKAVTSAIRSRAITVSKIDTSPVEDARFSVPTGWKREQKQ